jgi:hypothetical protein
MAKKKQPIPPGEIPKPGHPEIRPEQDPGEPASIPGKDPVETPVPYIEPLPGEDASADESISRIACILNKET